MQKIGTPCPSNANRIQKHEQGQHQRGFTVKSFAMPNPPSALCSRTNGIQLIRRSDVPLLIPAPCASGHVGYSARRTMQGSGFAAVLVSRTPTAIFMPASPGKTLQQVHGVLNTGATHTTDRPRTRSGPRRPRIKPTPCPRHSRT